MGLLRDGPAGLRWGCRLGASGIPALHKLLLITKQPPTSAKKKKLAGLSSWGGETPPWLVGPFPKAPAQSSLFSGGQEGHGNETF